MDNTIFIVCESGFVASAMGASILRKRLAAECLDLEVRFCRAKDLPEAAVYVAGPQKFLDQVDAPYRFAVETPLDAKAYDAVIKFMESKVNEHE